MKKTDLDKLQGKKILGAPAQASGRYGSQAHVAADRREQRERDRQAGLVPFAVKLHGDLVAEVQERARAGGVGINEITAELLRKGLDAK